MLSQTTISSLTALLSILIGHHIFTCYKSYCLDYYKCLKENKFDKDIGEEMLSGFYRQLDE